MDDQLLDHSLGLEEFIGQAVGRASVCWIGGTGDAVFDSTAAAKIVEEIQDYVTENGE